MSSLFTSFEDFDQFYLVFAQAVKFFLGWMIIQAAVGKLDSSRTGVTKNEF